MGFKAIILIGLLMAILLQITSHVAARDLLAETTTSKTNGEFFFSLFLEYESLFYPFLHIYRYITKTCK